MPPDPPREQGPPGLATPTSKTVENPVQCNLIKSDESTFFVLNVNWVFVRNWVLPYINENAKRSDASIYIFTFPCLSLLHLVQVKQIIKVKEISTHQTLIRRKTLRFPRSFLSQNVTHGILNSYEIPGFLSLW